MADEGPRIWTPGGERPTGRAEPRPEEVELTPEQLVEAIRQLKVSDVVLSTFSTLAQLGYAKLEHESRDLDQARLAIESLRALTPVVEGFAPQELARDLKQVVANLQLAYASAAGDVTSTETPPDPHASGPGTPSE